jgi:hypothetical protein
MKILPKLLAVVTFPVLMAGCVFDVNKAITDGDRREPKTPGTSSPAALAGGMESPDRDHCPPSRDRRTPEVSAMPPV